MDCLFLQKLPPEIRLRIYDFIFDQETHTSLLIRSDSRLEVISLAKAHAAILKTCKTVYHEACPVLYDSVSFRIQIYPIDGFPSRGKSGTMTRNTVYLPRIRHVEIKACVIYAAQTKAAMALTRTFVDSLQQARAKIVTLRVLSNFWPDGRLTGLERPDLFTREDMLQSRVIGEGALMNRVLTGMGVSDGTDNLMLA